MLNYEKILILNILIGSVVGVENPEMQLQFTKVAQCKEKDDLPIYIPPWKIEQKTKNNFYMTGHIILREDFPQGFKIKIDVKKCRDNVNSCDPFMNNVATKNLCQLLNTRAPLYGKLVEAFVPSVTCPLRSLWYNITEFKQDDALLAYMPGTGLSYWHATLKGTIQNRDILCVNIDLNVRPKRKRV